MQHLSATYLSTCKNSIETAKDRAREGAPHATLLYSGLQKEGRARMGRIWHSVEGCLHIALIVRPQVGMAYLSWLTTVCSLGVLDALRSLGATDVRPKWPNDLMYNGHKLGSVFVEAGWGEGVFAVCGIYLNVNQNPQLAQRISSSFDGSPRPAAPAFLSDVLANLEYEQLATTIGTAVLDRVDAWEQMIVSGRSAAGPIVSVLNEYYDQMDLLAQNVEVVLPDGRVAVTGMLAGMDIWGRVTVLDAQGREHEIAPEQASVRPAS